MSNQIQAEELERLIKQSIPDAEVKVYLFSGDDHFEMEVASASFAGLSKIAQHKKVYAALGDHMQGNIHALALKTRIKT